jgi:hypothetical protein
MPPVTRLTDLTRQERVYRAIRERVLGGAADRGSAWVIDALAEEFEHRL